MKGSMDTLLQYSYLTTSLSNLYQSVFIAVTKCWGLCTLQREEICLAHSSGGLQAWCQHQLGYDEGLMEIGFMEDGIMAGAHVRGRGHRSHSRTGSQRETEVAQ